ncbi:histone deacetylase complex subunit SAP30 isoform X2 [Cavia porcellus]|uniref:histone deacetylase complex subunit SAP30 isoform X2 n=1 Tax=Cavia porcellus TaxID=10141 RepID=UPI002FE07E03
MRPPEAASEYSLSQCPFEVAEVKRESCESNGSAPPHPAPPPKCLYSSKCPEPVFPDSSKPRFRTSVLGPKERAPAIGPSYFPKARHLYICDYHKNLIQSVRNRRKRKGSDDDGGDSPVQDIDTPEVDLYQLQVNTLRRYKRHFKLPTRPGLNKAQLVEIVGCHFRSIPVNEKDTLTYFIYSVKNDKSKSDLKVDSGVH